MSIRNSMQLLPVTQYSLSCKRFVVYHGGNSFLRIKISKKMQMFIEPHATIIILEIVLSTNLITYTNSSFLKTYLQNNYSV